MGRLLADTADKTTPGSDLDDAAKAAKDADAAASKDVVSKDP